MRDDAGWGGLGSNYWLTELSRFRGLRIAHVLEFGAVVLDWVCSRSVVRDLFTSLLRDCTDLKEVTIMIWASVD